MAIPMFIGDPTLVAGSSVDEIGSVTGLRDGSIAFVWQETSRVGNTFTFEGVRLSLMDGVTGALDAAVPLRGSIATGMDSLAEVTELADGRLLVSWLGSYIPGVGRDALFRIYDAKGRPQGDMQQIDPGDAGNVGAPDITALENGGFVAAWEQYKNGSWEVFAQTYGADGLPTGAVIRLNGSTEGDQGAPEITALSGGGFMAVWQSRFDPNLPPGDDVVIGRIFAADGSAATKSFVVSKANVPGNDSAGAYGVVELAGGLIAVTWQHSQEPADPGLDWITTVKTRLFGLDGKTLGPEIVVSQADPGQASATNPVIAALQDGRFMVAWTEYRQLDGGSHVMARIVNADGSFSSDAFSLAPDSAASPNHPTIAVLADGRVMVTYGVQGTSFWGGDLVSQLLDPREAAVDLKGTSDGDALVGTGFGDKIAGGNGRDHLLGAEGADRLLGQTGNDRLDGGAGKDQILGGGGADELTGGAGRDVFVFAQDDGQDRITDFTLGQDKLNLRAFGFSDAAQALAHFTQGPDGAIFAAGGTEVLLSGLDLAALDGAALLV